ncbi:glycosyltransferase [Microbulbifer elongatus]|uniref:glycosyltransferase n=1 Tax=Microbulbifer elongatus TaxID=86173 RepID=UPI001CFDF3D4|nr:glycosyltransferase [Microbulbifer elongatus]
MLAKVFKFYDTYKLKGLIDRDFYRAAYGSHLRQLNPDKHFSCYKLSLDFDPRPDVSLRELSKKYPGVGIEKLLQRFVSDKSFYRENRSVSLAVFRHFGVENNQHIVDACSIIASEFDEAYYLEAYPDVSRSWIPPHAHYVLFGANEGRNPNDWFDSKFYLEEYSDVASLHLNPFSHYIEFGRSEKRFPNNSLKKEMFRENQLALSKHSKCRVDPDFYLEKNPDVREAGLDPESHYYEFGEAEGRWPNQFFNPEFYSKQYSDVAEAGVSALDHYRDIGFQEGREALCSEPERDDANQTASSTHEAIYFDEAYYLQQNPDVAQSGIDPYEHYKCHGEIEGRRPQAHFCPKFYKSINADVRASNISPFQHYIDFGFSEGRLGTAPEKNARSTIKKPLLFVGHDGIQAGSEIVLLEVVKWFYENTDRHIKVLLLSPGVVANQYAQYADMHVLPNYSVDNASELNEFIRDDFEFVYINTVVSGRFFKMLSECELTVAGDIVTHIHEMEKVIDENIDAFEELKPVTTHWISASPASTDALMQVHGVETTSITTVPAFIRPVAAEHEASDALKTSVREELGLSQSAVVIAGCGTVYWRKGPDLFLEAAREILRDFPEECQFLWIGDGPDLADISSSLTKKERKQIKFIGSRSNANELLAAADIFFLSSREDPFPLVVMEAAQHSVPTVCFSEATGITAFVKDDAGVCVKKMQVSSAVEAITKLVIDRESRRLLGATAKSRVFAKYTAEQQCLNIFAAIIANTGYKPAVSVVVPLYNHAKFAEERVDSILNQSVKDIEVILMDDCSVDDTVAVVNKYSGDPRVFFSHNDINSGSPFKQWRKGLSLARGDVVWIAEGDDTCSFNFLETLLPYFDDPMMSIASAKTEIINEGGELQEAALDPYLNGAYPGKFEKSYINDGFVEVEEQLGAVCTLVNASGLLVRKAMLRDEILLEAGNFKMCGDWYVYLSTMKGGKIAYDVNAKNYFRRHSASAVHKIEGTKTYFDERVKVARYVFENFPMSRRAINRVAAVIDAEWDRFKFKHEGSKKEDVFDRAGLVQYARPKIRKPHVGLYVHGMTFSKGGIERLAADLTNKLVENGYRVTIYCRSWGGDRPIYPLYQSVALKPIFNEHEQEASIAAMRSDMIFSGVDIFIPMLSEWLFEPVVAAADGTGIPVVVSEHNDPEKIVELWWDKEKRIQTFEKASAIHLILDEFKRSLPDSLISKVSVIPNFVKPIDGVERRASREKVIIAVGRLAEQKRMDRLVSAFSLLSDRYPDWSVHIYGEGELRSELEQQIQNLQLQGRVILKGRSENIGECYRSASIFAISSEFEAFGIVVAEAQQNGLPCVGLKHCNGPNVLIRQEENGFLIDALNEDLIAREFSEALEKLILDEDLRAFFGRNAVANAATYELNSIFPDWERLIEDTLQH